MALHRKKRRLNRKVLGIVAAVCVLLAVGGFAAVQLADARKGRNVQQLWEQARASAQTRDWKAAKAAYETALRADPSNAEGFIAYGDVLRELSGTDPEQAAAFPHQWERALMINPRHEPALTRLVDAYTELTDNWGRPEYYNLLKDKARALASVQPGNERAKALEHVAILGAWLGGSTLSGQDVRTSLDALKALLPQKPDEWRIPWTIARASVQLSHERQRAGDTQGVRSLRQDALDVFDQALKHNVSDDAKSALKFRQAEAYRMTLEPQQREPETPEMQGYQEMLANAVAQTRPEHPDYVPMQTLHARVLAQLRRSDEALEKIEMVARQHPNDSRVRHMLARVIAGIPGRRDEAIALLAKPLENDTFLVGFRATMKPGVEVDRLMTLAGIRVDAFETTRDAGKRAELRKEIDANLHQASLLLPEKDHPELLKLQGQLALLDGGHNALRGMEQLRRAFELKDQRGGADLELMNQLAGIYLRANEDGSYRDMMEKIVQRFPAHRPARKALIHYFISRNKMQEAEALINQLQQRWPRDPDAPRLRVMMMLTQGDKEKVLSWIKALPERSPQEVAYKAAAYMSANQYADAVRLITPLHQAEMQAAPQEGKPAVVEMTGLLAMFHLTEGKKEDAGKVAGAGLAKSPKDFVLRQIRNAVEGKAADPQISELTGAPATAGDPVGAAIRKFNELVRQGKTDEALKHVIEEERRLNSLELSEHAFNELMNQGRVKEAEPYYEELVKAGVDQAGGALFRIRWHLAHGRFDEAVKEGLELTRRAPGLSRSWTMLGQAQHADRQVDAAVASYEKALSMQTENPDALRGLVIAHIDRRRYAEARPFVDRGLKTAAREQFVGFDRHLAEQMGDPFKVTSQREADFKANPDKPRSMLALAANYSRCAEVSADKKDDAAMQAYLGKARELLEQGLAKWPDEPGIYEQLALVMYNSKQEQEGVKVLARLASLEKWKGRAEPHLMLASYHERLARKAGAARDVDKFQAEFKAAEDNLKQALAKSGNNLAVQEMLARFYMSTGQAANAAESLRQLMASTKDPAARRSQVVKLAELEMAAGQFAAAESLLGTELASAPNDAALLVLMGRLRMVQKNEAAAEQALAAAAKAEPRNPYTRYWLGQFRYAQLDFQAAIDEFKEVRALIPGDARGPAQEMALESRVKLAELYRRRGMLQEAGDELEQALSLRPNNVVLRMNLIDMHAQAKRWPKVRQLLDDARKIPEINVTPIWWRIESEVAMMQGDTRAALAAVQKGYEQDKNHEGIIEQFVKILIKEKQYDQVLKLTDPLVKAAEARAPNQSAGPWWLYAMRGQAQAALGRKDLALGQGGQRGEFDNAMSAVDTVQDDGAAEELVRKMTIAMGPEPVVARLEHRANARWTFELIKTYGRMKQWKKVMEALDQLLAPATFDRLPPHQKLLALRLAAESYSVASNHEKEAIDKGIAAGYRYLEESARFDKQQQLDALNNLAVLLIDHPKVDKTKEGRELATKAYELMLKMGAQIPAITDTYAWSLVRTGEFGRGIAHLRLIVEQEDCPVDAYYHLGEAYLRQSQPGEAYKSLKEAVDRMNAMEAKGIEVNTFLRERAAKALAQADLAKPAPAGNIP